MLNSVRLREVDTPTPTPRVPISTLTIPLQWLNPAKLRPRDQEHKQGSTFCYLHVFGKFCTVFSLQFWYLSTVLRHSYRNMCIYVRGVFLNCGQIVTFVTSVFVVMDERHLVFLNKRLMKRGAYVTIPLKWKVAQKSQNCLRACPFFSGKPCSKKVK